MLEATLVEHTSVRSPAVVQATAAGRTGRLYGEAAREADQARRVKDADEKVPLVQAALRRGQYERAFDLRQEVEPVIPDHPDLPEMSDSTAPTG